MPNTVSKAKWIIPPGLHQVVNRFNIKTLSIIESKGSLNQRHLLLHGPTGVGKSMFTDFFIKKSEKVLGKTLKVITVNCAALPENLLESELFGYDKGAFSGATKEKPGFFEQAGDGILVLEEIGEMPKFLQAKLLVAIEKREFYRLGGTTPKNFNAQIVATTNVGKSQFREDFWFRFDAIKIPPIHERRQDILYYIELFHPELIADLKRSTVFSLLSYNWPGNVREIRRVCYLIKDELKAMDELHLRHYEIAAKELGDYDPILGIQFDPSDAGIDFRKPRLLRRKLDANSSSKSMQQMLNLHGLGFDFVHSNLTPELTKSSCFSHKDDGETQTSQARVENTNLEFLEIENDLYQLVFAGIMVFCKVFFKNIKGNYDLLDTDIVEYNDCSDDLMNELGIKHYPLDDFKYPSKSKKKNTDLPAARHYYDICSMFYSMDFNEIGKQDCLHSQVLRSVLEFYTGIKGISLEDLSNFIKFCRRNSDNKFVSSLQGLDVSSAKPKELSVESITMDELILLYYETVCSVVGISYGFQKKLANISGRKESTVSQKLNKIGFKEKFEKSNTFPKKRLIFLDE